jgi:hypothetical protein
MSSFPPPETHDTLPPESDSTTLTNRPERSTLAVVRELVRKAEDAEAACVSGDADTVISLLDECDMLLAEAMRDFGNEPAGHLTEAGYQALGGSTSAPAAKMHRVRLLDLARQAVARGEAAYGAPWPFFSQAAALWSALLGQRITAAQVAMCMVLFKVSRLAVAGNDDHADSWVDVAGYAALGAELAACENGGMGRAS